MTQTGRLLVYGATGFSGRAIAASLRQGGHLPILAGRSGGRVRALAEALGLSWRVFDAPDRTGADAALAGIGALLNAAGPFAKTAPDLIDACIRNGVHYLDISGEWPVFAHASQRSAAAAAAGVMLMPGAAFSIVVSDCLMAQAVRRHPDTVLLRVAGSSSASMSRGSLRSAINLTAPTAIVRRDGALAEVAAGTLTRWFNFGSGERMSVAVSGPDVVTAQYTTGVPNIETYLEAPLSSRLAIRAGALTAQIYGEDPARRAMNALSRWWPDPSPTAMASSSNAVVVEAVDSWRRPTRLGLKTINSYDLTTLVATTIARRVADGDHASGFQTPAGLFGPDFLQDLRCTTPFDAGMLAGPVPGGPR